METSTGLLPEAKKMRVSFLVLAGVIAVCNTDASAKAVAPVATEDEASGVGQSPAEEDLQNDTAYETTVNKSNAHGGEHVLSKRYTSPDSGKRRSVVKKTSDKKRKTESKKVETKKFEEHESKSVKNKINSRRTEKGESQDEGRHGLVSNDWFMPQYNSKTVSVPVIYKGPPKNHAPWSLQANFAANLVGADRENRALPTRDLLKVQELAEIFHTAMKGGLDSMFDILGKELKKKMKPKDAKSASNANTRSTCIDMGDGSCLGEFMDEWNPSVAMSHCSDDSPTTANESGDGIGQSDTSKRNSESPLEYLQQTLPVMVEAVQTIMAHSVVSTRPPVGNIIGDDYGFYDWKSGDEAAEPPADHGTDNEKWDSWFRDDSYTDRGLAEQSDFVF